MCDPYPADAHIFVTSISGVVWQYLLACTVHATGRQFVLMPVIPVTGPDGMSATICLEAQCALAGGRVFGFSSCSRREGIGRTQPSPGLRAVEWTGECESVLVIEAMLEFRIRSGNTVFTLTFAGVFPGPYDTYWNMDYEIAGIRLRTRIRWLVLSNRRLAVGMGLHRRLGAGSILAVLGGERALLAMIMSHMA